MANFLLIGACGYIAERHLKAIKEVDGKPVDFSAGFTELHTESYRRILAGDGFRPADALPAIKLIEDLYHFHRNRES